jgi:hypothetical protein
MNPAFRLCSYIVPHDKGLAPNPFWGFCTLALCTPNHIGIKAESGDWFVGFSPIARQNKLIYAMEVSEVLNFDQYYHDQRFQKKRPNIKGNWRERCGDNIYFKNGDSVWEQHPTIYHHGEKKKQQDLQHPYVFIGENFYYFGENAIKLPIRFRELIIERQGVKCNHDRDVVVEFLTWLEDKFEAGIHGLPIDRRWHKSC